MSTNIINITNTLTNIINMPTEVTNNVLRVAELSALTNGQIQVKTDGWAIASAIFTMASAIIMAWSVCKMGEQIKISQESVEEMRKQRELQQRQLEDTQKEKVQANLEKIKDEIKKKVDTIHEDLGKCPNRFDSSFEGRTPAQFIEDIGRNLEDICELYFTNNLLEDDIKQKISDVINAIRKKWQINSLPSFKTGEYIKKYCKEYNIDTENSL